MPPYRLEDLYPLMLAACDQPGEECSAPPKLWDVISVRYRDLFHEWEIVRQFPEGPYATLYWPRGEGNVLADADALLDAEPEFFA